MVSYTSIKNNVTVTSVIPAKRKCPLEQQNAPSSSVPKPTKHSEGDNKDAAGQAAQETHKVNKKI